MTARTARTAQEITTLLNDHPGPVDDLAADDLWNDVINHLPEYDPRATENADPSFRSDVVVLKDGSVIRWIENRQEWVVAVDDEWEPLER